MTSLRCHEWDKHQSYRRDRNPPPWIKVHRNIMQNRKWARLSDAEKGQLISLWVLAADRDGHVPNDAFLLKKICMLDAEPDLKKFIELGLLTPTGRQRDASVTPERRQSDAPEADKIIKTIGSSAKPINPFADEFAELWKMYPKRSGSNPRNKALHAYSARRKEGTLPEDIRDGLMRYVAWCKATGKIGTETVMQAQRFFGPGTEWENEFIPPPQKIKLPTDNQALWAIRSGYGMDPFFDDLATCHREILEYMQQHPETRPEPH